MADKIGPGEVVGFGNGLILGYTMWKTRLCLLSILGLTGGPALLASSTAVVFGYTEIGSTVQDLPVASEFLWELLLGIWLLVRGFSPSALSELDARQA